MITTILFEGDIKKIIGEVDLLKHHVETRPSGSHIGTSTLRCDINKVIEFIIFHKIQQL